MNSLRKRLNITFILSASLFLLALYSTRLAASALTLAWDPNTEDDLAGYKVYYGVQSRDYDFVIDVGDVTQYTVTDLEPETQYYFAITAYDTSSNESGFSVEVSAVTDPAVPNNIDPTSDIKANGSDGPLDISSGDMLSVTVECDEGNHFDVPADWWLVANTAFGWHYYNLQMDKWLPGFRVTYQGPLFDLTPPIQVMYKSGLPTNSYTFYFGVDENMNGTLDEPLYYDVVEVNITP
jgi:hypothetical protein